MLDDILAGFFYLESKRLLLLRVFVYSTLSPSNTFSEYTIKIPLRTLDEQCQGN